MAFLAGQKFTLCLDKGVFEWCGDTIPLLDVDGRLLANNIQLLQPTSLPPGMGAPLGRRLISVTCKHVGLVESSIYGDTGVAVVATIFVDWGQANGCH